MAKQTILVADDSVTLQKVFNLAFEKEDIEVLVAGDGSKALELVREHHPDLVIADVSMPLIDGFELCQTIKEDSSISNIPVFLIVSSLEEFDEKRAEKVGAIGKLEKPFRSEDMVDRVKAVLAASGEDKETDSKPDDAEADTFDEAFDISIDSLMEEADRSVGELSDKNKAAKPFEEKVAPNPVVNRSDVSIVESIMDLTEPIDPEEIDDDGDENLVEIVSDDGDYGSYADPMADSTTSTQLPVDIESAINELESTQFGRESLDTGAPKTGYLGDDVLESEDDIEGELSSEAKEMLAAIENSAESLTAEITGEKEKDLASEDLDSPDEDLSSLPDIIPEAPDEEPSIGGVAKSAMVALDKEAIEKEVNIAVRNSVERQVEEQVESAIKKALAESIDTLVAASVEHGVAQAVEKAM
ncbi:hypothetical protein MNBD_NITROSPINAE03-591, partial [hydrothermal vent metagenome]